MDFNNLFTKAKEVQDRLQKAKENLVHISISAESGAGMVKVTVNGKKQLTKVELDPDIIKQENREIIQDLVIAAANKALTEIDEKITEELKKSTEGLLPNIPGFNFGQF
jgi:DNA-binding YbaB/EbfC family protein